MTREIGYVRDADQRFNPLAVRWWYVRDLQDGLFVRGGRVATARLARYAIDQAKFEYDREVAVTSAMRRPRLHLRDDGSLMPIPR